MKQLWPTIILCIVATCSYGQSLEIGYSPNSSTVWATTPDVSHFTMGVNFYETGVFTAYVRYVRLTFQKTYWDETGQIIADTHDALFFIPLKFRYENGRFELFQRSGLGRFFEHFPTVRGMKTHFILEAGAKFRISNHTYITLVYSHISNGYRSRLNPGVDNFVPSFVVSF
ncbi:MAG: acyloxyacyl hydrolase [Balneolales bacterium]